MNVFVAAKTNLRRVHIPTVTVLVFYNNEAVSMVLDSSGKIVIEHITIAICDIHTGSLAEIITCHCFES